MKNNTNIDNLILSIHWLTVVLIAAAFISIEFKSSFGKENLFHDIMKSGHFYIGITILFLTILRIVIQPFNKLSITKSIDNNLQKFLAKSVHKFLYIWLIIMPMLGWSIRSAAHKSIPFGLPRLPIDINGSQIGTLLDIHETLAYIGLAVIFIHAVAGIYHYRAAKLKV